jgi:hypothetical protein
VYTAADAVACVRTCTPWYGFTRVYTKLNNIHGGFVEAGSSDSAGFVRSARVYACLNGGVDGGGK